MFFRKNGTMTIGIFGTWEHKFSSKTEQALTDKIKKNPSYPFKQDNNLFIHEYLHDNTWKGALLLIASTVGTATYMNMPIGDHHKYAGFLIFSLCVALWLVCSGVFCRRLVIDHDKKEYRYYLHTHLRHRGPLHQIYIRMIAQKSGQGQLMFKLILNGYKIEERELSGFSEKYELLECQGRRIATKLNLNYFDYKDTSKHHMVVHRPKIVLDSNAERVLPV